MEEEFILPLNENYTVYSKSGCKYCLEVKQLLKNEKRNFIIINCDVFLIDKREIFLEKMEELTNKKIKTFPIVFHNGLFIGGFEKTREYCDTIRAFENYDD